MSLRRELSRTLSRTTVSFKHNLDELIASHLVIVFHVASEIEREGWEVFERFNTDKTWSFTDCTSKVIMERAGIEAAFTFDQHFVQMGLVKRPF